MRDKVQYNLLFKKLIDKKLLTPEIIDEATIEEKKTGKDIFKILVGHGYITEDVLLSTVADWLSLEIVDIGKVNIERGAINKISSSTAKFYNIVPLKVEEGVIVVAVSDPLNMKLVDELRFVTGFSIKMVIAKDSDIKKSIERYYGGEEEESLGDVIDEAKKTSSKTIVKETGDVDKLKEIAQQAPVVKLLNMILLRAIREKASDIHFEPFEKDYKIRYRIDGVCYDAAHPPKVLSLAVGSRIKVMANLDVAETRLPQDGRIMMDIGGKGVDLRVSTLPTLYGESIVMRVLDKSVVSLSLDQLGMEDVIKSNLRKVIHRPNGILLTTGPTGSGKTTTLYSCLREINKVEFKIITAEDPVEYDIEGIIQIAVNPKIELTFAKTLRHMLRQDPDILMVGEIRDSETAQISIQSALTGHLVFSTLHTNDAPGAVTRLMDMGIEPYLIGSTLRAVIAQRLLRVICQKCKKAYKPLKHELSELGISDEDARQIEFYKGEGCSECNSSGYKGRIGIYELLIMDDKTRELVIRRASSAAIRNAAREGGMKTLRENAIAKIKEGVTSLEEVLRETKEYG
ncbi:MAG: type II secretion system ATPase GspE [Candidatus Omnitrophica bacterium]|nr:type II secretion system ATPase GspE [Candidatus Omnitrophota bacterium]MBU1853507.1 type II secretion system ATPase GspE [Candidatus Omnitrophota bacterium]